VRSERFEALRLTLLSGGVDPRYAERTALELSEHYADLEADALATGLTANEAALVAGTALGTEQSIVAAVLARPELLSFSARWPRVALCLRSAAAIGALPGLPVMFCIEHRPELLRWSASLGAAAALVGSILAWLNWMILLA
jgi:hypothetical protein